mmetsp:Transcript_21906/g.34788  ORF Transcript_21906/g.34788 Transcript_21906/m.34788 type:complete len:220 (+) Transcript_21906:35-694(+)
MQWEGPQIGSSAGQASCSQYSFLWSVLLGLALVLRGPSGLTATVHRCRERAALTTSLSLRRSLCGKGPKIQRLLFSSLTVAVMAPLISGTRVKPVRSALGCQKKRLLSRPPSAADIYPLQSPVMTGTLAAAGPRMMSFQSSALYTPYCRAKAWDICPSWPWEPLPGVRSSQSWPSPSTSLPWQSRLWLPTTASCPHIFPPLHSCTCRATAIRLLASPTT